MNSTECDLNDKTGLLRFDTNQIHSCLLIELLCISMHMCYRRIEDMTSLLFSRDLLANAAALSPFVLIKKSVVNS